MLHFFGHTLDLWATPYAPWQTWTLVAAAFGLGTGITGLLHENP